jgi:hypothetical protein
MLERLKKLAVGLSARGAVEAFARQAPPGLAQGAGDASSEFAATIEAMFLMAAVDGVVSPQEVAQLAGSVQAILDTGNKPGRKVDVRPTLEELNAKLAAEGWKARLDATAARLTSPEARSFAFRLAVGVALVDDHVAHAEAAAIDALAAALRIRASEVQDILSDVEEMLFS